jgi:hypothetical protein
MLEVDALTGRAPLANEGKGGREINRSMSEESKCPMGKYPRLAAFLALAFILLFLSKKFGLL